MRRTEGRERDHHQRRISHPQSLAYHFSLAFIVASFLLFFLYSVPSSYCPAIMVSKSNIYSPPAPDWDYANQSVAIPGTQRPGQTAHYRNAAFPLLTKDTPGVLSVLPDVFELGLSISRDQPCLGHLPITSKSPLTYANEYVWETFEQVDRRRRKVGSAITYMFQHGLANAPEGELETVGVWSINRPEWQIIDLALHAYGKVGVSLYDTLGPNAVEYIINHASVSLAFAAKNHVSSLLKLASKLPALKTIVSIDALTAEERLILKAWGEQAGIDILDFPEVELLGEKNLIEPKKATPDQVASICYTSGTTSNPKGVVLTHAGLAIAVHANLCRGTMSNEINISYLPLAHIYARITELCVFGVGGRVGYSSGDPLRLLQEMQILKPTLFASVPRVLNRIYQSAMANTSAPGIKGALFRRALAVKLQNLKEHGTTTHPLYDRLVFNKVAAVLGGRVRSVTTGSAPISPKVINFLKLSLGADICEGYGMTENSATTTLSLPGDDTSGGTVGPPQISVEVKLIDVPSMGYSALDKPNPRGEVCVRGDSCFTRYYKDPENTKSTVDEEGWTHTGDVGELDQKGRFKIIDRVKNIMKLSQGEYVALEKVENVYSACPAVAQIYVHGDSLQPYLIAVVVPEPAFLARVLGVSAEDVEAMRRAVKDPKTCSLVLKELTKWAKKNGLKGFEMVKRVHVTTEPFSVANGTLTPTFKLKRRDAHAMYKAELDALYELGELASSSAGSKL